MRSKAIRALAGAALLGATLQPCLACTVRSAGPGVAAAAGCHDASPTASPCEALVIAPTAIVAPATPTSPALKAALSGPLPALALFAQTPPGFVDRTLGPPAPPSLPPLWLRHASLRI